MPPDEIYRISVEELDWAPASHIYDHDFDGQFLSSHADKQQAILHPEDPIGVAGRDVCPDCREFLRRLARERGQPLLVRDQTLGPLLFQTDGSVITADGTVVIDALPPK